MTDDIAAAVESPYTVLTDNELMEQLVEETDFQETAQQNIREIRAELLSRVKRGEPLHYIATDPRGESEFGYGITATRTRGAHRWKYTPKAVMRRLEGQGKADAFTKTSLDTKTFNSAMDNNNTMRESFADIVSSKYDNDKLMVKGLTDLLKARGL